MEHLETTQVSAGPGIRFSLFLFLQGRRVKSTSTRKIGRVYRQSEAHQWDRARIVVRYGDTGVVNEGEYASLAELKAAIRAFTEPDLIRYANGEELIIRHD